ncbi:hypothetical protein HF086_009314 [Spodoptera exigua]|uniref:Uncharacterized protein n=1 Tax=Spodoptera exigua TaxID=7107 RepID=A0A922MIW8_SPOEX|nr:hypothetical protein HF086_009314 [Spodoptera exigua]
MATATAPRKTISIYDYPEHLNPFHEEDNHNKIRFWTLGKRLSRSNSINFSGLKDLRNSWDILVWLWLQRSNFISRDQREQKSMSLKVLS